MRLAQFIITIVFFELSFLFAGLLYADSFSVDSNILIGNSLFYENNLIALADACPGSSKQANQATCGQDLSLGLDGTYNICSGCVNSSACHDVGANYFNNFEGLLCYWDNSTYTQEAIGSAVCRAQSSRHCGEASDLDWYYSQPEPLPLPNSHCFRCYNKQRCENISPYFTVWTNHECRWSDKKKQCETWDKETNTLIEPDENYISNDDDDNNNLANDDDANK